MSLSLTYHLPPRELLPFVAGGYVVRSPGPIASDQLSSLLGQFHWQIEGRIEYDSPFGIYRDVPRQAVIGSTTRSPAVLFHGPFVMVGVGFLPAGWRRWTGTAAHECRDLIAPMEAVSPPLAGLATRLDPELPDAGLAKLMYKALLAVPDRTTRLDWLTRAIDHWLVHDARSIGRLCEEVGISHRQLNRLALETHGAPLRLLSMKFRTLRCAARIAAGAVDHWSESMIDEFCDQPHMIRNFRRFIGTTPGAFMGADSLFSREIMRERLLIRSDNPLAAWG